MDYVIRKMQEKDRVEILDMMQEFYSSDAVYTNGSLDIFEKDIDHCINDCPFLEGYVFAANDKILGYAMIAKSFSTEFGKVCIWLEDLYLKKQYRGLGIIPRFISFIEAHHQECIFKLEVENDNEHAVHVYKKYGFEDLPYVEMIKR